VVVRLAKSVLPENTMIQKEAVTALVKSATVFINYLAATYSPFPYVEDEAQWSGQMISLNRRGKRRLTTKKFSLL
jgi:hypothetical protein